MKHSFFSLLVACALPCLSPAQVLSGKNSYDLSKDRVLYTIGYAHLDTEWNWDYPTSINEYIRNIMTENFHLFETYPDYVFNFTGSRRYHFMKEYYPELYKKVQDYIKSGRWHVAGSSVDEAEVNMSSSESIVRQVLYGNQFFKKEFGTVSEDYMIPDCFGFVANLPSVLNYCGLSGFSTQKLTWHSAVGIPFNVGIWNGPDGKGVVSALNATDYGGHVVKRLDKDNYWDNRITENQQKYGINFDYRYYGVGDQGGAPRKTDVRHVVESLHNSDSKFKVELTSADQMFKDITPEIKTKLPVYTGDLLLIEHSAGSLTSEAFMKRMNRKNELLAQSAELAASAADWMGQSVYPFTKLNNAWELVLGSQFHDILPGTAIPRAYEYAWNDEFVAANGFASVLQNAIGAVSDKLNTDVKGKVIVVYNPVAKSREDVVSAILKYGKLPTEITVFDKNGKAVPTQITGRNGDSIHFIFLAKLPSAGMAVFDVREGAVKKTTHTELTASGRSIENSYYRIRIAENGDIESVYDKKEAKELLSAPARLAFLHEHPSEWPAWNMDWKDRKNPPIDYLDKDATVKIVENGPVRVALQVTRNGRGSEISQVISLAAGEAGKHVEVSNQTNWQSRGVSLKATFPLTVSNEKATYNLGLGTIDRTNNNEKKFEVPSKEWFDLTDKSGNYGVSILEDCKYGSDKPDDNTLRLTLLYTPVADQYVYQGTQDWGVHNFRYGIYGHKGDWAKGLSSWEGKFFNQPLLAFEVGKHAGSLGKEWSLLDINTPQVGLMALKKQEEGDYYIIRVNELFGKDAKNIQLGFPSQIMDAYEVNGQEQRIGNAVFDKNSIRTDIPYYGVRSFAVKFKPVSIVQTVQTAVALPYNQDVMSFDDNRTDGDFDRGRSLPAELIPSEIVSEDLHFKMGNKEDEALNAVSCKGQKIDLPKGNYTRLYLLAAATEAAEGDFTVDQQVSKLKIQKWTDFVGQYYNRHFTKDMKNVTKMDSAYSQKDNIAWFATHRHIGYPSANDAYRFSYIYKYVLDIPRGSKTITLPQNDKIKIFAITAAGAQKDEVTPLEPLYDDFSGNQHFELKKE